MSDLFQSIHDMPLTGMIPAFMLLVAGIVLWLAGRRVLRGAFILMGLLIGGLVGLLIDDGIHSGMPGWVLPTLCAVVLAVFAAITYRIAAAAMMALVLGLACPLSVIAVNEWQLQRGHGLSSDGDEQIEVSDSISDALHQRQAELDKAAATVKEIGARTEQSLKDAAAKQGYEEQAAAGISKVKSVGRAVADAIISRWTSTPKRLKPMVSLSALIGALSGLVIGLIARKFSDCAVTAMVGAAIWLSAAVALVVRTGVANDAQWIPRSTLAWLGLWLATAIIGLVVQWARKPAPADKPA